MVPDISQTEGIPIILVPLVMVILVNGIKDFFEDFKRKQSDDRENNTKCQLIKNSKLNKQKKTEEKETTQLLIQKQWKNLKIGQLVKIKKDENFPADLILLYSSNKNGSAFSETKNLDGETNLKYRESLKNIFMHLKNFHNETDIINELLKLHGSLECEDPNPHLYEFKGILNLSSPDLKIENNESVSNTNLFNRKSLLSESDFNKGVSNLIQNILKEGKYFIKKFV